MKLLTPVLEKLGLVRRKNIQHEWEQYNFYPISYSEPQDIFVASYPRSGVTWMQNIISGLLFGIDTQYLPDKLTQEIVPDVHYKQYYKRMLDFVVFKTHHLPQPAYKRVVHLVRDPRDAMVSYYYFNQALGVECTLEEMIKNKQGVLSSWHQHTKSWLENPYHAEIMTIKFEDLKQNTESELLRLCDFIKIERSKEIIERVIKGNEFKTMQAKAENFGFDNIVSKTKWNPEIRFFRKGESAAYNELLNQDLREFLENEARSEMKQFGYL